MKYTVKRKCGHEEEANIFGKSSDRERKVAWMEETVCRECYRKAKAAEDDNVISIDLPDLEGTPKQIAWAEDIRRKVLADVAREAKNHIANAPADTPAEVLKEANRLIQAAYKRLASKTPAKWWIDNRRKTGQALMKMMHETK